MQPAAVSSVGLVALAGARHTDWAEAAVTKRRPCPVKKGGEKEEGRRREGGGRGRRGPGAQLAPPARQSRGCRERSARRPGPGHRTPYRTRPSLELGQPPTTDTARALPPTGLDTTTDTTSQLRTLLLAPFPRPWTLSPPSAGAQTLSPQQALAIVLLHPSTGHGFLPAPYSPLLAPHLYPVRVRAPLVSPIPRCSGDAARAPIPRLLARMPLPGGLWWLLCCRRGFTLLHRDYGDGELSGDGDEDEDDETFELRTPSPAGGRRVSLEGFRTVFNSSLYNRSSRLILLHTRARRRPLWPTGNVGEIVVWKPEPRELQGQAALHGMCLWGLASHTGRCPPAGGPEAEEASRVARPGPASPFPAGPASHPVSFRLRQSQRMWRGRLGGSNAWVRSAHSS